MEIENWATVFTDKLKDTFKDHLLLVGLQGSYGRGEATEKSDIDMVVVLTEAGLEDLRKYKELVSTMPYSEKACGFISGLEQINAWPKHDLLSLYSDTKVYYGSWTGIDVSFTEQDKQLALNTQASAIYHALCHNYIYEDGILEGILKSAFFAVRLKHHIDTGKLILDIKTLIQVTDGKDKAILQLAESVREGRPASRDAEALVFAWARGVLS